MSVALTLVGCVAAFVLGALLARTAVRMALFMWYLRHANTEHQTLRELRQTGRCYVGDHAPLNPGINARYDVCGSCGARVVAVGAR